MIPEHKLELADERRVSNIETLLLIQDTIRETVAQLALDHPVSQDPQAVRAAPGQFSGPAAPPRRYGDSAGNGTVSDLCCDSGPGRGRRGAA